ncbi:MAG: hypothetical protein WC332_02420 [Clostridia bacterium]|jgi:hypothetical protein
MKAKVIVKTCECGAEIPKRHILCPECARLHRLENNRRYRIRHKTRLQNTSREKWRNDQEYREKAKQRSKNWYLNNPEKVRALSLKHAKLRYYTPEGRIRTCISRNIYKSLHGKKYGKHWEEIVGYTLDQLKNHLEKKFQNGMTWENYGKVWHVDHKIPVSVFNFKNINDLDFKRCWSLSNLQPMFAFDNQSKGNKLSKPFQPSLAFAA